MISVRIGSVGGAAGCRPQVAVSRAQWNATRCATFHLLLAPSTSSSSDLASPSPHGANAGTPCWPHAGACGIASRKSGRLPSWDGEARRWRHAISGARAIASWLGATAAVAASLTWWPSVVKGRSCSSKSNRGAAGDTGSRAATSRLANNSASSMPPVCSSRNTISADTLIGLTLWPSSGTATLDVPPFLTSVVHSCPAAPSSGVVAGEFA